MLNYNNSGMVIIKSSGNDDNKIKVKYDNVNFDPTKYYGGTTSAENIPTSNYFNITNNNNVATTVSDMLRNSDNEKGVK